MYYKNHYDDSSKNSNTDDIINNDNTNENGIGNRSNKNIIMPLVIMVTTTIKR